MYPCTPPPVTLHCLCSNCGRRSWSDRNSNNTTDSSKAGLQTPLMSSPDNHPKTRGPSFSVLHSCQTRFRAAMAEPGLEATHPPRGGCPEVFILVLPPTLCFGGLQLSPARGQTINAFRFAGQIISAATQLCHCSMHGSGHRQPVRELDVQQSAMTEFGPWGIVCQAWFQITET